MSANLLILNGDARAVLKQMPSESVHCVVTSPPYWGLRDYGCEGQMGLERTPDAFVAGLIEVFREVRRVLREDGTIWVNLGDTYQNAKGQAHGVDPKQPARRHGLRPNDVSIVGLKPKDLVGIPWMTAFALRNDGWYLRQDIVWHKPNPMPESVVDRCTKAHEFIFLMSKSSQYYFDQEAILEDCSPNTHARLSQDVQSQIGSERANGGAKTNGNMKAVARRGGGNRSHKGVDAYESGAVEHRTKAGLIAFSERQRKIAEEGSGIKNNDSFDAAMAIMPVKRNPRSVWTVGSKPFKEAHFATFPPKLIEPCILAGCPKGGIVLDPFFGAGTTGLVAQQHGRRCIGIELNPEYVEIAKKRLGLIDLPLAAE